MRIKNKMLLIGLLTGLLAVTAQAQTVTDEASAQAPVSSATATDDASSPANVVARFRQLMADGNKSAAYAMISDDAYWQNDEIGAPWSGIYHGQHAVIGQFSKMAGTTRNMTRHTDRVLTDGDSLIEFGSLDCILVKTGKPYHTEFVSVYKVRDGKLTYYRIYEDSLKLYRAYYSKNP
jgi:ketosteroid isomerase-like protein